MIERWLLALRPPGQGGGVSSGRRPHGPRRLSRKVGSGDCEKTAYGSPVIACAAAGPSETFWDGHAGVLDDTDDMDGFITAIDDYVRRPARVLAHK